MTREKLYKCSKDEFRQYKAKQFFSLAEFDYIHFRWSEYLELPVKTIPDFIASQTIEKYFKCILLLSGENINRLGHSLSKAFDKLKSIDNIYRFCDQTDLESINILPELCILLEETANGRYYSTDIDISDSARINRMDFVVIKLLRPIAIGLLREFIDSEFSGKLEQYINKEHSYFWENAHHAVTHLNLAVNPNSRNIIDSARSQLRVKELPGAIIISDQNIDKKQKIENFLGIKISNDEYKITFVITQAEFSSYTTESKSQFVKLLEENRNKRLEMVNPS